MVGDTERSGSVSSQVSSLDRPQPMEKIQERTSLERPERERSLTEESRKEDGVERKGRFAIQNLSQPVSPNVRKLTTENLGMSQLQLNEPISPPLKPSRFVQITNLQPLSTLINVPLSTLEQVPPKQLQIVQIVFDEQPWDEGKVQQLKKAVLDSLQ